MAFAEYRPDYVDVLDAKGHVVGSVRPLNDVDFALLWQKHEPAMEAVLGALFRRNDPGAGLDMVSAISGAMVEVPDLLTDAICIASDEADNGDWSKVFKAVSVMPIGLRISAMNAVIHATAEAEGGLDKVAYLMASTRPTADE